MAAFVAGLGTGGTVTGVGHRLKSANPAIKVYAAEPQYGDLVYGLRNLDEGYVPEVLDPDILDSRIKVDSRKALAWTRRLVAEEGIFAGVSTGASLAVAARVCTACPRDPTWSPCRPTVAGSTCPRVPTTSVTSTISPTTWPRRSGHRFVRVVLLPTGGAVH